MLANQAASQDFCQEFWEKYSLFLVGYERESMQSWEPLAAILDPNII